jgi:hypothetical protein
VLGDNTGSEGVMVRKIRCHCVGLWVSVALFCLYIVCLGTCVSCSHFRLTLSNVTVGRAMAQAVSHRPRTAEARLRSRVSPCGICGGQSDTRTGFFLSTSVFPCQFHSTVAPLLGKGQKIIIIIFITGLYNKPQGCGVSVASAAGPFVN